MSWRGRENMSGGSGGRGGREGEIVDDSESGEETEAQTEA